MIYRRLGKTNLQVSILGFGASPLGNEFGQIDSAEGSRAVHYAIEQGVNYFDVSPYYGRTLAETRLGQALTGCRDKVILATKVGRYDKNPQTGFDFSASRVVASVEESLARLQTDYLDVLLAHDIEFARPEQIIHETLPAMRGLKQAGKVRFVGITGYPLHLLKAVAEAVELDVILSYCHYNLMDTTLDAMLTPLARQKNLGLINASPLHMGLLTETGAPAWHPAPKRVVEAGRQAADLCRHRRVDIAALALQFALQNEAIATTLVGMSRVSEVAQNVSGVGLAPDPELLAEVRAMVEPVANLVWQEGRPENYSPGAVEK